jgi:hypothetical protein
MGLASPKLDREFLKRVPWTILLLILLLFFARFIIWVLFCLFSG